MNAVFVRHAQQLPAGVAIIVRRLLSINVLLIKIYHWPVEFILVQLRDHSGCDRRDRTRLCKDWLLLLIRLLHLWGADDTGYNGPSPRTIDRTVIPGRDLLDHTLDDGLLPIPIPLLFSLRCQ